MGYHMEGPCFNRNGTAEFILPHFHKGPPFFFFEKMTILVVYQHVSMNVWMSPCIIATPEIFSKVLISIFGNWKKNDLVFGIALGFLFIFAFRFDENPSFTTLNALGLPKSIVLINSRKKISLSDLDSLYLKVGSSHCKSDLIFVGKPPILHLGHIFLNENDDVHPKNRSPPLN